MGCRIDARSSFLAVEPLPPFLGAPTFGFVRTLSPAKTIVYFNTNVFPLKTIALKKSSWRPFQCDCQRRWHWKIIITFCCFVVLYDRQKWLVRTRRRLLWARIFSMRLTFFGRRCRQHYRKLFFCERFKAQNTMMRRCYLVVTKSAGASTSKTWYRSESLIGNRSV